MAAKRIDYIRWEIDKNEKQPEDISKGMQESKPLSLFINFILLFLLLLLWVAASSASLGEFSWDRNVDSMIIKINFLKTRCDGGDNEKILRAAAMQIAVLLLLD